MVSSHTLEIPLFKYYCLVIFGDDHAECEKQRIAVWNETNPSDPMEERPNEDTDYWGRYQRIVPSIKGIHPMPSMIFITRKPDGYTKKAWNVQMHVTIAHECLHAAHYLLDYIGVETTSDNNETLAYTLSFMQKECIGMWEEFEKKKNHNK